MAALIGWILLIGFFGFLWLAITIGTILKDKPRVENTGIGYNIKFNESQVTVFSHSGIVSATGEKADIMKCIKTAEEQGIL